MGNGPNATFKSTVSALAEGRVWSGRQAAANGLIDELGGLDRAIPLAKELAQIPAEDDVRPAYYPEAGGIMDLLLGKGNLAPAAGWAIYRYLRERHCCRSWRPGSCPWLEAPRFES